MNEEIKEILELFAFTDENIMFGDIVELNSKQSHLLLDYITNLQEENEKLKTLANKDYTELNIVEMKQSIYKARIDKALEIYENRNSIKYKNKRFMEDKTTADLMYEALQGDDNNAKDNK